MSRSRRADTDFDLVTDLQRGDLAAFSEIVVRYQQVVCAVAFSACGRQALSEDVAQETFVAAWKNIAKLEDSNKLKSWLCSIARNRARDVLRKRRREVFSKDGDGESEEFQTTTSDAPSPLDRAVTVEEEEQLWVALKDIPEGYRETLVLFYRDGQSIHQVAEGLELSVDAVKQRLSRGRAALRDSLGRVSHCLARTQPSKAFTVGVIAAVAAQSGVAAAASAAGLRHSAGAQSSAGTSKGGLYSFGFSCMAALVLGVSALLVWTLLELAPTDPSQLVPEPPAGATAVDDSRARKVVAPPTATSEAVPQEFRIEGKVVDLFQRRVPGATVYLGGEIQRTTVSDESGNFFFPAVERGAVAIQARNNDGSSRPLPLHVDADTEKLVLQLMEGSTLEIRLQDGRGGPALPGIEVQLASKTILLNATTDEQGRARFRGLTTSMNIATVQAPGFASSRLPVFLSGEAGLHRRGLFLLRGVPLSGVVRNEAGEALSGAKVTIDGDINSVRTDSTTTDSEGRWSFEAVAAEDALLTATHEDYPWVTHPVSLEGVTTATTQDLVMPEGRSAQGKVVYADGTPAAFAMVHSQPTGKPVRADADGKFTIRGLEARDAGVLAKHKVFGSKAAELKHEGPTNDIRLVLEDHSVRGVIIDGSGQRVAGAQLHLVSSEAELLSRESSIVVVNGVANSRGEFSLGPLPGNSSFNLVAAMPEVSPAYLAMEQLRPLEVRSGQRDLQLQLDEPGRIVGRVVGPDGKGVDEFALIVGTYAEALEEEASSPFSGTDGEFVLSALPPGNYAVAIVAEGLKPRLIEDVVVRAGGNVELGVVTLRGGAVLRGRVVDAEGQGVQGARVVAGSEVEADHARFRVFAQSADEGADPFQFNSAADREVYSDKEGFFELPNMHSRRGRLFAAAELKGVGRSRIVKVSKRSKGELRLTLQATGSIAGSLSGEGKGIRVSAVLKSSREQKRGGPFRISAETNSRDFEIGQLTQGTYVLSAHATPGSPDYKKGLQVEVRAGEIARVTLQVTSRDIPPWDAATLEASATHTEAYCACASESCRLAEDEVLEEISESHEEITGPDYEELMRLEDIRRACEK